MLEAHSNSKTLVYETAEESQFKEYVQVELLLEQGLKPYADELNNFKVKFIKAPGLTAAVDVQKHIVIIDPNVAHAMMYGSDNSDSDDYVRNEVSFLIRHEMLHSILQHSVRAFIQVAEQLGYDAHHLTKPQFDEVMKTKNRPNYLFRNYNAGMGIKTSNASGDFQNSHYYLPFDLDYCKDTGGLVLADYPNWADKSFEELNKILNRAEKILLTRALPVVVGTFNDDGTFDQIEEKKPFFETATQVAPRDIVGIRLPMVRKNVTHKNSRQYNEVNRLPISVYTWLDSDQFSNGGRAAECWNGDTSTYTDVLDIHLVQPVLICRNMDLYKSQTLTCFGKQILPIDSTTAIFTEPVFRAQFGDYHRGADSYKYKESALYFELNDWFREQLEKYKKEYKQ